VSMKHLYLNQDSSERKGLPMATGLLDYFPAALAYVAKVSKYGNDKHNPGQPMHHARGKSMDHADCIARHIVDRGGHEPDSGLRHSGFLAWRALALLQEELELEEGAPLARGARLPEPAPLCSCGPGEACGECA
jgi:hypothetical protein